MVMAPVQTAAPLAQGRIEFDSNLDENVTPALVEYPMLCKNTSCLAPMSAAV